MLDRYKNYRTYFLNTFNSQKYVFKFIKLYLTSNGDLLLNLSLSNVKITYASMSEDEDCSGFSMLNVLIGENLFDFYIKVGYPYLSSFLTIDF